MKRHRHGDAGFGFAALAGFVDALAFNFIVGNADAHAKNFSLLYRDGNASLAPVYDTLSTAVYPNLTPRMAMNIGGARDFNDVNAASFDAFAVKCDINPNVAAPKGTRHSSLHPTASIPTPSTST